MSSSSQCKCGSTLIHVCPTCNEYTQTWKWISTRDHWPESYRAVLAIHNKYGIVFAYRWMDYEESEEGPAEYAWEYQEANSIPKHNSYSSWRQHHVCEDNDIIYWIPLPDCPRE